MCKLYPDHEYAIAVLLSGVPGIHDCAYDNQQQLICYGSSGKLSGKLPPFHSLFVALAWLHNHLVA